MSPQPIFIPLAAGVQTELADELVQLGATVLQENFVNPQTGKAQVRFGSDALAPAGTGTIPSGGTVPDPWQIATMGGQLVRFARAPVPFHAFAATPVKWVAPVNEGGTESYRRGPIKLDSSPVFAGSAQVSDVTVAVGTDVLVCTYRVDTGVSSTSGGAVAILDRTTRKAIYLRRTLNNLGHPRVVIVGTRAVVAYESGGFLQVDSYNLTTFALAQQQTMGALLSGTAIDMRAGSPVAGANNVGILYRTSGTGQLRIATVDATDLTTNSTITPRTSALAAVVPDLCFGWMQDLGTSGKFSVMWADSTNGLNTLWDLPAPTAGNSDAVATHVLDAAATASIRNIIGTTITSASAGVYRVLYESTAGGPVRILVAVFSGGSASTGTQFRFVGIRSKFWSHAGNFYLLAAFDSQDQRTYFVMATAGDTTLTSTTFAAPLAVSHPRDAGGLTENPNAMSDVGVDGDGAIYMGVTQETRTDSVVDPGTGDADGDTRRLMGADVIRVRHPTSAEMELGKPAEYLKSLFVPGGLLGFYDGSTYAAAGFAYFPTGASAVTAVGGNLDPSAAYRYRFVYSFIDRNGRTWRSAPSTPVLVSTTGTDFQFDLTIDTLRLVDRGLASGHNAYSIEIYRTQANATEGYFQVAVIANDPTNNSVAVTDNVADDDLGTQLYTDGGGAENQLLPPTTWCVEHQGRLVVGESGTGTIWYSTEADFQSGPIFNEALTFDVADPAEPTTGAAVYNEQLFVCKAGRWYVVGGQFANALGQGANLSYRLIDGGVGCDNPQSIVVADGGVWFRSGGDRAGIYRTNGGEAEYVGAGVRAHNDLRITSAVVVKKKTQIRWYTLEGTTLVWDWTTKTWGTHSGQSCLSATAGYGDDDEVVYASSSDSSIRIESTAESDEPYKEAGSTYLARLRSPWYKTTMGGWQRIKRIQGVGRMETGRQHKCRVSLYKDLDDSVAIQTAELQFDGTETLWKWELRPEQQKCAAMMIEVQILPYQPPDVVIAGDVNYDGFEVDTGYHLWTFDGGNFVAGDVGGTIVIAGGPAGKNGTYTIEAVVDSDTVSLTPAPADTTTGVLSPVPTVTMTPPAESTAGPEILGVNLIPMPKEGAAKLGADRRLT